MQSIQNNKLYEKLYYDSEFRNRYAKKIQEHYNEALQNNIKMGIPTTSKPITDKDLEEVNDQKKLDRYYKCSKAHEKVKEQKKLVTEIENKIGKVVQPGLKRTAFFNIKLDGSEESQRHNEEYIKQCANPEFAKQYIYEKLIKAKNSDITEYIKGDADEQTNRYLDNMVEIQESFCVVSLISNQSLRLPDEIDGWFNTNKSYIEAISNITNEYNLSNSPLYAVFPNLDKIDFTVLMTCLPQLVNEMKEAYKEAGETDIDLADLTNTVSSFGSGLMEYNQVKSRNEQILNEKKEGHLTKDFMDNYVYTKDGKDCSFLVAMDSLADPEKKNSIKIRKLDEKEREKIQKTLSTNCLIEKSKQKEISTKEARNVISGDKTLKNIDEYIKNLVDVQEELENARGLFRKKSPAYTNMKDKLDNFIKDINEVRYGEETGYKLKITTKVLKFLEDKKDDIRSLQESIGDYQIHKAESKKLDKYSESRLKSSAKLNSILQFGVKVELDENNKKIDNNKLQNKLKNELAAGENKKVSKSVEKNETVVKQKAKGK